MICITNTMQQKAQFLQSITSHNGKMKYKRFACSPLRYAGGKTLAVGIIIELMPDNIKRLVSPFMGGGSVEIACANNLSIKVIGYDIFKELIIYWDVQLHNPNEIYKRMLKFAPTKQEYYRVKDIMKLHWDGIKKLNKYDCAATFYYNHNTSYGPHFLGWPSSVYLNETRYKSMIERSKAFKAPNLSVDCMSFEKSIPKHKRSFMYCDPPYYLDDSKMFVGMYPHRNFPIHHVGFDHEKLRDLLYDHKGGFILSYNDCPTIRKWYKEYDMITPEWQYTFGQGDTRIGKNRLNGNGTHIKKSHELIIWDHPK